MCREFEGNSLDGDLIEENFRQGYNKGSGCDHSNWHIEEDEAVYHPDDPRNGQIIKYAVCELCGKQGWVSSDGSTVDWGVYE